MVRMDAKIWASGYSAAKRQHAVRSQMDDHHHHHRQHRHTGVGVGAGMGMDDIYEVRAEFTCPFCYQDFDIATLCFHLEDHHPFEFASAVVCPVCEAKVGKDVVGHITIQHGHLFKAQRRRRSQKGGVPSNVTLSYLNKELWEGQLHSLFGGAFACSSSGSTSVTSDPLLSSLVYMLPKPEPEEHLKPSLSSDMDSNKDSAKLASIIRAESNMTAEEWEQKLEEEAQRAEFVQQLVLSTFLGNYL